MFTSAAPQDPLFWVLHGFADRYVTFKRALAARNATALDETWGYDHVPQLPSDTRVVCDWSAAADAADGLPTGARGATCPGHREFDVLPMGNFTGRGETYTNRQFWDFTAPSSDELPYVYEEFSSWPGCSAVIANFSNDCWTNSCM